MFFQVLFVIFLPHVSEYARAAVLAVPFIFMLLSFGSVFLPEIYKISHKGYLCIQRPNRAQSGGCFAAFWRLYRASDFPHIGLKQPQNVGKVFPSGENEAVLPEIAAVIFPHFFALDVSLGKMRF